MKIFHFVIVFFMLNDGVCMAADTMATQCPPRLKTSTVANKLLLRIAPHPDDALDVLLKQAYQAYVKGDFDYAQSLYLQVFKQAPRNQDALLGLAVVAQYRGAVQEALDYYAQVLRLDPQNASANAGIAALNGDENLESQLKHWLQTQPDSAALHLALGNYYASEVRWAEAQQAYFVAYRLAPQDASIAFNLAVSLEQLGQNKLAAQHYQRAVQLDVAHRAGIAVAPLNQHIEALLR
ncbi:MAG: tetratricopeptide repeat protein [Gallionella sp.]|nr:tetratricopeptide repeat protein [Gallionella sp.]MDD4959587.1 tetratricopeptide repeat protein [Gallionella sp.]